MKIFKALALLGGLIVAACSPANAAVLKITNDNGGIIVDYIRQYSDIRSSGGKIVVDGPCLSACTLFLGVVPKENACATPAAQLGFHSATTVVEENGKLRKRFAAEFTELMFNLYPAETRDLLRKNGWAGKTYHPNFLIIKGDELFTILRKCGAEEVP